MRRSTRLVLSLLATAMLLSACGDDDTSATDPTDDATETDAGDQGIVEGDRDDAEDSIDDTEEDPAPEDQGSGDEDPENQPGDDAYIALNANGIETDQAALSFGDDADTVLGLTLAYWGEPDDDSGDQPSSQDCLVSGDTYRRITFGDVMLIFVDDTFDYWMTTDPDQNTVAFVGDSTIVPILPGHTTVAELRDALGDQVDVADEPPLGPSFFITDNFGTLFGEVDDIGDEGIVQSVSSGVGCGE